MSPAHHLRRPLAIVVGSRLALFAATWVGLIVFPQVQNHRWRAFPDNLFLDGWARWDSGWHVPLGDNGYALYHAGSGASQEFTTFFPLYGFLSHWLGLVFSDSYFGGFLIANLCLVASALLYYQMVSERHGHAVADRALMLLVITPFAFFFSAVYSESLFLLTAVGAMWAAERERWLVASLFAAAAGATRLVGIVVVVPVVLQYLAARKWRLRDLDRHALVLPLGVAGLAIHMLLLWRQMGDPLAFLKAQWVSGWGSESSWDRFAALIDSTLSWSALRQGRIDVVVLLNVICGAVTAALVMVGLRRNGWIQTVWGMVTFLISITVWRSLGRYTVPLFPACTTAALLLTDRDRWYSVVVAGCAMLLALLTFLFSHGFFVA